MDFDRLTGAPSTLSSTPPKSLSCSPVAATTMSASSVLPDFSASPVGVKRAIWSVTTSALPLFSAKNRSASGTRQSRWSQGS